jgi:two-component system, NarL family, response regulator DevR
VTEGVPQFYTLQMKGGLKVVLMDENCLVRLGVASLLRDDEQFGQVVDVGTGAAGLVAIRTSETHVAVTDVHLPDMNGTDLCRQIRQEFPHTQVLFLTSCRDESTVIAAMLAGAHGYVLKSTDPMQLLADIKTVAWGGSVLDAAVSDTMMGWMRRAAAAGRCGDQMTDNERRILPRIAQGKTNKEIADELYLSEHTVKTYVSGLLKKLQLTRRAEVAAYVARLEHAHGS